MPQLPSGRHFAIDTAPLQKILDDAQTAGGVHHLMNIDSIPKLFQHIEVLYFRPIGETPTDWTYCDDSIPRPTGFEPYPSGFNLETIRSEYATWDAADQAAFVAFLNEERVSRYFEHSLSVIREHQERLLQVPSSLPGLLATWWKLGCHPLQEGLGKEA